MAYTQTMLELRIAKKLSYTVCCDVLCVCLPLQVHTGYLAVGRCNCYITPAFTELMSQYLSLDIGQKPKGFPCIWLTCDNHKSKYSSITAVLRSTG